MAGCSCAGDCALLTICVEHCVFKSAFLSGDYSKDFTHMNVPAAERFGCCLLMHDREDGVQFIDSKSICLLKESDQGCSNVF